MIYLSQMLGCHVLDAAGTEIGKISDLAIATGEVFPRITSLAFLGPSKTPFMISWRKYVDRFDDDNVYLKVNSPDIRFSYLQPDEILLSRDLMDKQIVDTQGLKVVRVNDLKFSTSGNQLRLLGAEVGVRGLMRGLSPHLENAVCAVARAFRHPIGENIIAWSYMDLLDRDLSQVKLSVSHKRLHELHPADVADILEQLDPQQRASVFEHLDNAQAAETISELEDEYQSDVIDDLPQDRASTLLATMDPDDAADIIADLPYEKAETLLRLMGVREERVIRRLLGYKEKTAGGIMTTEYVASTEDTTVGQVIEKIRNLPEDHEPVQYVYTLDDKKKLTGVLSLHTLVLARDDQLLGDLAYRDIVTVLPDVDQEEVAGDISKYNILAMPVVDEDGEMLGIVTVDDALDVLEEEHDEDLAIAGASPNDAGGDRVIDYFKWFLTRNLWLLFWAIAAIACAATGTLTKFSGMILLMPVVLSTSEDVATFAVNSLIEYEGGDDSSLASFFGRDFVVGVFVSLVLVLITATFAGASHDIAAGSTAQILAAAVPAIIAVFIVILLGTPLSAFAKHRYSKGKITSGLMLAILMMICGALIQLMLTFGQMMLAGTA